MTLNSVSRLLARHVLAAACGAVLIPLFLLIVVHCGWLNRLHGMSVRAHQASLDMYLDAVTRDIEQFYRSEGERVLDVPASFLEHGSWNDIENFWRHTPVEGVRTLFVIDYPEDQVGTLRTFDFRERRLVAGTADPTSALFLSSAAWQFTDTSGRPLYSRGLRVDERNPGLHVIMNPICADDSRIFGVAGMVLDEEYFRRTVLPRIIDRTLPRETPAFVRRRLSLTLTNPQAARPQPRQREDDAWTRPHRLSFVFTDLSLGLDGRGVSPDRYSRVNFTVNLALSFGIFFVVIAGAAQTLSATERSLKLSRMKSEFVSNVSHELRTPLATIRVFSELVKDTPPAALERVVGYGELIEIESRRLSRLIDDLLDFSGIESGRKTYELIPTDLEAVIRRTLETFRFRLRQKGFDVVFERPDPPLPPVPVDRQAMGHAVGNLVDNALKYSGTSRTVRVELRREGRYAVIDVTDFGVGIPRAEQRRIFRRFHRAPSGLSESVKGIGLGLSIVAHILKAHGGRVSVRSAPGAGSTFSLHIPLRPFRAGVWNRFVDRFQGGRQSICPGLS